MPPTTGFPVILMDNLEGRRLARHSPTSSEHKIGHTTARRCQQKVRPQGMRAWRPEDGDTFEIAQDYETLAYDDQGMG